MAGTVSIEDADARVRDGCYACLIDARTRYLGLAKTRSWPTLTRRLFEVELLIALRERELGLDPAAAIASATELARRLPAAMSAERYLAAVASVPHDRQGWPRGELSAFRRGAGLTPERAREEATWFRVGPLTGPIGPYLATAIECSYDPASRDRSPAANTSAVVGDEAPPIVRYRVAICGVPQRAVLERLRSSIPEFVETSFYLGQIAVSMIAEGGVGNPHSFVADVLPRFPDSPAVTYLGAALQHAVADWDRALGLYDRTLALKPLHEDAWAGRTISLTELGRHAEAVEAASRMVGLRLDNVDQALYWRAFNHHAMADLRAARSDIDEAKARARSIEVLTLAGIIEHDQDELEIAARDLSEARRRGQGRNCRADWYYGAVLVKQRNWEEAAPVFESAMTCYDLDVTARQNTIRVLEAKPDVDPVFKKSRVARLRFEIDLQRHQQRAAAFNAANGYAQSGNLEKARPLVEVADADPALRDEIAELRRHMAAVAAARAARGAVAQ